ncbi:DMT family transporter [Photorhabdus temperata]|uniref:EamA-like transporter family n=1 Tax=Photorhabdus temperata subsp. temperata Meg1 TaxID=1393735 RepID=A0A081S1Z1_PHOTE|nr:DMT family transporter [Photorhabdus temperata]KER04944.1 EamA-like transporter family [Photorhabdus temperata subsp. temperata Meg1]MCT8346013.1 DMT family transporter [Photorhabdus temperata]
MLNDTLRPPRARLYLIDIGLIAVALSWGASYSLMKLIIQAGVAVPLFLMLRFALSVPFMFMGTRINFAKIRQGEVVNGVIFGVLLYAILTFETLGVKYTTASNAGFLIALSVILVPIFERVIGKKRQSNMVYLMCLLSLVGGGLLSFSDSRFFSFNNGDILILLAALIRGFQIFMFGRQTVGKDYSLVHITLIELVTVAVLGLVGVSLFSPSSFSMILHIPYHIWGYILFLSLFATAFAFLMQLYAAKVTSPTRVGLIISLEPAFAAMFAIIIMQEHIGLLQSIGGGIILFAALVGRMIEGK